MVVTAVSATSAAKVRFAAGRQKKPMVHWLSAAAKWRQLTVDQQQAVVAGVVTVALAMHASVRAKRQRC